MLVLVFALVLVFNILLPLLALVLDSNEGDCVGEILEYVEQLKAVVGEISLPSSQRGAMF